MRNFLENVLAATHTSSVRGFSINDFGVALLRSGTEHVDSACAILRGRVAQVASEAQSPAALITRFPGLGYILQYLLKEGLYSKPNEVISLIAQFPDALLAETLNVAARLNASAARIGGAVIDDHRIRDLLTTKLYSDKLYLRDAIGRYHKTLPEA